MQIKFKLFATLMSYLPPQANGHELMLEVDDSTTAFNIIDQYDIPRCEAHLVLVNGVYLNEDERDEPLKDGDTLSIWPPVAGG